MFRLFLIRTVIYLVTTTNILVISRGFFLFFVGLYCNGPAAVQYDNHHDLKWSNSTQNEFTTGNIVGAIFRQPNGTDWAPYTLTQTTCLFFNYRHSCPKTSALQVSILFTSKASYKDINDIIAKKRTTYIHPRNTEPSCSILGTIDTW